MHPSASSGGYSEEYKKLDEFYNNDSFLSMITVFFMVAAFVYTARVCEVKSAFITSLPYEFLSLLPIYKTLRHHVYSAFIPFTKHRRCRADAAAEQSWRPRLASTCCSFAFWLSGSMSGFNVHSPARKLFSGQ